MKIIYEDYWKNHNKINTSIKLPLNIKVSTDSNKKISNFEKVMMEMDLIYEFNIHKFNNKKNIYKIIFNGSRNKFLQTMKNLNYEFETNKKIWIVK